jgi:hypothetical protein
VTIRFAVEVKIGWTSAGEAEIRCSGPIPATGLAPDSDLVAAIGLVLGNGLVAATGPVLGRGLVAATGPVPGSGLAVNDRVQGNGLLAVVPVQGSDPPVHGAAATPSATSVPAA